MSFAQITCFTATLNAFEMSFTVNALHKLLTHLFTHILCLSSLQTPQNANKKQNNCSTCSYNVLSTNPHHVQADNLYTSYSIYYYFMCAESVTEISRNDAKNTACYQWAVACLCACLWLAKTSWSCIYEINKSEKFRNNVELLFLLFTRADKRTPQANDPGNGLLANLSNGWRITTALSVLPCSNHDQLHRSIFQPISSLQVRVYISR